MCAKGLYIAMISTTVETDKPELEIRPALDILGDVLEMFVRVDDIYTNTDDGKKDNVSKIKLNPIAIRHKIIRPHISL